MQHLVMCAGGINDEVIDMIDFKVLHFTLETKLFNQGPGKCIIQNLAVAPKINPKNIESMK